MPNYTTGTEDRIISAARENVTNVVDELCVIIDRLDAELRERDDKIEALNEEIKSLSDTVDDKNAEIEELRRS